MSKLADDTIQLGEGRCLRRDPCFGFLRVEPVPTDEELARYYADRYRLTDPPHDVAGRMDLIASHHKKPGRALDIGCGEGEFLSALHSRGWNVTGIEPGERAAAKATQKGFPVHASLLTPELVHTLGTFDLVILAHVLEHVPRPEQWLGWIRDLLKPGGLFYCEVPNDFNPLQQAACHANGASPWWIALPDHLNYFSIESLARFIESFELEILDRTTDFPMELFLLMGEDYVSDPSQGKDVHRRRCRFEQAMRDAGQGDTLSSLYRQLATINLGRQAIVIARKP